MSETRIVRTAARTPIRRAPALATAARGPGETRIIRGSRGPAGPTGENAETGLPYAFTGAFQPSEILPGFTLTFPFSISAAGSRAHTLTNPTGVAVFKICKNAGTQIGTVTFSPGNPGDGIWPGVFAISDPDLIDGDLVYLVAPATPDATLRHLSATLKGA